MANSNVRNVALDMLMRIEKEGGFSHLLLSQAITKNKINEKDENLLSEIVYGTIERKLTLDFYLAPFIKSPKKLADWVNMLLRMSVFQMEFLDNVPEYAIIHEAVQIAKRKGHKGIASLVNGVLRSIQRKGVPSTDSITDDMKKLSVETSHPDWLIRRWVKEYGFAVTKAMCETNITKKPVSIRVNRLRTSRSEVLSILEKEGIEASLSPYVPDAITLETGNIFKTNLMNDGLITIQDQSSMLASKSLQVEPSMHVLDTCSAPGGKATYIGELMENQGTIYAYDLHQNKTKLIKNNADRLGLTNIHVGQSDARNLETIHEEKSFDRILIDAPCSGLGVIRSKPDIKYNKTEQDIKKLQQVQLAILLHVAPLLKDNGKLVYSTCTVDIMENEEVVKEFLNQQTDFKVDEQFLQQLDPIFYDKARVTKYGLQLFPQTMESDGFFMTRLCKKSG